MVSGPEMTDFSGICLFVRKRMLMKRRSYCHSLTYVHFSFSRLKNIFVISFYRHFIKPTEYLKLNKFYQDIVFLKYLFMIQTYKIVLNTNK